MALWRFETPNIEREEPFAWNVLHERFGMPRGVTVYQTAPGANYATKRYGPYTDELGSANLPSQPSDPQIIPTGLNTFRGGYDWIVNDATRTDMINSGVVSQVNFWPVGSIDVGAQGATLFKRTNLYNNTVAQDVAVDRINNVIYTAQLMQGGIQLPDEGAPVSGATRSANGDVAYSKLTIDGRFLAVMYVRGSGHGLGLAVDGDSLWIGGASSGGFSTGLHRTQFIADSFRDSSSIPLLSPFAGPNNTGLSCKVDTINQRIAVRRTFPAGDPNGRQYSLFDLNEARQNIWTPLFTVSQNTNPVPGSGEIGTFQGFGINGDFIYSLDGDSGTVPGNTYLTSLRWSDGVTTQRVLNAAFDDLTFREPEGVDVWVPNASQPEAFRLVYGYADGLAGGRNYSVAMISST